MSRISPSAASYYLAPDSKGSEDVYAVLREAIARTGKVALTRIVIAQRERTIALRPMDGGLVAHTLNEQRDLNPAEHLQIAGDDAGRRAWIAILAAVDELARTAKSPVEQLH